MTGPRVSWRAKRPRDSLDEHPRSPCRTLSPQEIEAIAASMGLPVAPPNQHRSRQDEEKVEAILAETRKANAQKEASKRPIWVSDPKQRKRR